MKIGAVLRTTQGEMYKELNNRYRHKHHKRKKHKTKNEKLTFSDIENLMRHDSYARAPGGAFKQKTWGK